MNLPEVENAYVFVYANTHSGSGPAIDNDIEIYIDEIWAEK